jgi:hypothetical protein
MGKEKRITYQKHGRALNTYKKISLDELPAYLEEKYSNYKLSEQTVEFAMKVAAGEDAISAAMDVYNLDQDNVREARRTAKELMQKPKVVDMINIIRQNYKHQAIVDTNSILTRLEMMYSDCIIDGDRNNALKVLKQMSDIVTKMDGQIEVGEININFTLPNAVKAKRIDIEEANIEE